MFLYRAVAVVCLCYVLETKCYVEVDPKDLGLAVYDKNENKPIEKYAGNTPPKHGWVDPFDMLGEQRHADDLFTLNDVQNSQLKFHAEFCNIHLLKFVNLLRRAIESQNPTDSINLVKLEFLINENQLNVLREFGKQGSDGQKLETVSDVLNQIFTQLNYGDSKKTSKHQLLQWLQDVLLKISNSPELTVVVSVSAMLLGTLWSVYRTRSFWLAMFSLLLTIFFAGFGFTWMRMYEEKEVERFHDSVMYGTVPYHCKGGDLHWYEHMYYRVFGVDCLQFYKTRDVRPMVKISPTDVLGETLTSMFINPASNIGRVYGNFISSVTSTVPFWLKPIAVVFGFIIPPAFLFLVLALINRYRISFSITGFHFLPSWCQKDKEINCKPCCQYVDDVSQKENVIKKNQQHGDQQTLLSDNTTPLFLVNWLGLKKLITDVKVTNEEDSKTVTDSENQNNTNREDDDSKDKIEGLLTTVQKQNCKKRRGILTIGEGSSDMSSRDYAAESEEHVDTAVNQASGDYCESVSVYNKEIQPKEKRT